MRGISVLLSMLFVFIMATSSHAADSDAVLGVWDTEKKDARIEIYKCGGKYCGRIVWMKEPNYTAYDKAGRIGKPIVDDKNPNPEVRNRPVLGLTIMKDFAYAGENHWEDGKVYDPETGKTYSATMTLASPRRLHLRGYILFSLFGRTSTWTRADHN